MEWRINNTILTLHRFVAFRFVSFLSNKNDTKKFWNKKRRKLTDRITRICWPRTQNLILSKATISLVASQCTVRLFAMRFSWAQQRTKNVFNVNKIELSIQLNKFERNSCLGFSLLHFLRHFRLSPEIHYSRIFIFYFFFYHNLSISSASAALVHTYFHPCVNSEYNPILVERKITRMHNICKFWTHWNKIIIIMETNETNFDASD